jgi:hypothetical protein
MARQKSGNRHKKAPTIAGRGSGRSIVQDYVAAVSGSVLRNNRLRADNLKRDPPPSPGALLVVRLVP